jgi:hypothetical protein
MRRAAVLLLLALGLCLSVPRAASARPCSDLNPVFVDGVRWIVYTGDGPWELENLSCTKARRVARRAIRVGRVTRWKCSRKRHRCVRGGTYIDGYGHRQWRYLVGWHGAD